MSNKLNTKEQKRANFALDVLENQDIKKMNGDDRKKFVNFCAGVPNMILQNGFGQTLAFLAAKGKLQSGDKHTIILLAILDWLNSENGGKYLTFKESIEGNLKEISEMDIKDYLAAQREALALLEWIKRYAKAFIKEG